MPDADRVKVSESPMPPVTSGTRQRHGRDAVSVGSDEASLTEKRESINFLALSPAVPLSEDRVRTVRAGMEGIVRLREAGTTVRYNATVSRGIDGLGARSAADASPLLPLSRQGADDVF